MKKVFRGIMVGVLATSMLVTMVGCGKTAGDNQTGNSGVGSTQKTQAVSAKEPNKDAANTNTTDKQITIALGSEPSTLWGAACGKTENEECMIGAAMRDSLVSVDPKTNAVKPALAKSWEWVDATHCKFVLRDDVTMTDGKPLVADDVVYTVNVWKKYSPSTDTGSYVSGAVANDAHTVTIEFNVAAPGLLNMLAWSNFGIVSEAEVNAVGGIDAAQKNPVLGSGKYKFKEWKNGQYILLERNDNYWDKDYKGYYKDIKITFTADAASREMSVESGDADVAYDLPISQAATYTKSDTVSTYIYTNSAVNHLWYNMGAKAGEATKNIKVRQAIDKALDFDAIAQVGTAGFKKPATAYEDENSQYYTKSEKDRKRDIEGAKALLAEAGYKDGLQLNLLGLASDNPVYTVVQANLKDVGITVNIKTPDTAQFVGGAFSGDYDIIIVQEDLSVIAPSSLAFFKSVCINGPGVCVGGPKWTTNEIDSLVANIISETDKEKAKDMLHQLDVTMHDNMLCSNLYSVMMASVTAKDLKGCQTRERGYIDLTSFYK